MGSSRNGEFSEWGVHEMGTVADRISGVKLQGSNPGSLLRSKSTRRDRRCEAASERLVVRLITNMHAFVSGYGSMFPSVFEWI